MRCDETFVLAAKAPDQQALPLRRISSSTANRVAWTLHFIRKDSPMTPTHPFLENGFADLSPPLSIVLERRDVQPNGDFRPDASVRFGPELRTTGLLAALSPEDVKTLLWVLSFVTPNGACDPSLPRLAEAMGVSLGKAQVRLERLERPVWQNQPLLITTKVGPNVAFSPSPALVFTRVAPSENATPTENTASLAMATAPTSREAIIDLLREKYARPRVKVEREIARLNGWPEPPFEVDAADLDAQAKPSDLPSSKAQEQGIVKDQLLRIGLNEEQAEDLLRRFDLLRIRRQLSWLNYHPRVRNRAGFLIAAIEDNYEAPASLRFKHLAQSVSPPSEQAAEAPPSEQVPPLDVSDLFE